MYGTVVVLDKCIYFSGESHIEESLSWQVYVIGSPFERLGEQTASHLCCWIVIVENVGGMYIYSFLYHVLFGSSV